MSNSILDWPVSVVKGIVGVRGFPVLAILIVALLSWTTWLLIGKYHGDPHFRKAQKYFEAGDFYKTIDELEIYLSENPRDLGGLVLLGDAHAGMAEISRDNMDVFIGHVCSAIKAYQTSLDIRYNNMVGNKVYMLEERYLQGAMDPNGRMYDCREAEAGDSETGP